MIVGGCQIFGRTRPYSHLAFSVWCRVGLRAIAIRTYAWAPETGFFREYVGHTKYFRKKTRFLWLGA